MMEGSQACGEGGPDVQHVEAMTKKTTVVTSGQSENLPQSEDVPEDALGRCRLECLQNTSDCNSGKALGLDGSSQMVIGNSSSSHAPDLAQDEGSKSLELDKSLPPIKTRQEGQAREHSPSDLSPPSPKRLRQGSREGQDQWNGVWSAEGKQ